jgi:menaquinone-specific isochorismate synthase
MQIIPSSMLPERDKNALRVFLSGCQAAAQKKQHFQIASISLAVRHIAPLAVLESIYEPNELHFYVERPTDESALAGAEAVVSATFSGKSRFESVRNFADEILANTIVVGDLSEPFTGPHFFTAFSFADEVPTGSAFPAATVFLPRWQVSRSEGKYGAIANIRVDPDSDIEMLVDRVWAAYEKFGSFKYEGDRNPIVTLNPPEVLSESELAPGVYRAAVNAALAAIERGDYEKIVLARGVQLKAREKWLPLQALNKLRERFSGCYTFSFGGGDGKSFIGASPERLLKVEAGALITEAIAGSISRGQTAGEDARLARELLESEKDLREHIYVRDSIIRRLSHMGIESVAELEPRLLQLANVQHLRTGIQAKLSTDRHLLELVADMHPTPAVGGKPRNVAVPAIADLEQLDRGLYAGVIGWFNHLNEGEMIVGIRSALIEGNSAKLYAGAGIVNGSDPDKEIQETDLKLEALRESLTYLS